MPRRRVNRRNDNTPVDPAIATAVNQALIGLLPEIVTQTAEAIRMAANGVGNNHSNNSNNPNGGNGGATETNEIHVWLERFQKQKPQSFSSGTTPLEAENWISHIEKIFEVLGCADQFKARLATYKLEGDAHSWWKAYKQAKGGDAFVETLAWAAFRDIFYLQYFPASEKEKYVREYATIRQKVGESITVFMARFVRLVGIVGAAAGTPEEQAQKFKWAVNDKTRDQIVNMKFADVAEAADAAKNIELLQIESLATAYMQDGNKKRTRDEESNDGNQWRQTSQHSSGQRQNRYPKRNNTAYSNSAPVTDCTFCGKRHPSNTCYKATGACYNCGQIGHRAKDCKNNEGNGNGGNDANNPLKNIGGRVFAMTADQFAKAKDHWTEK